MSRKQGRSSKDARHVRLHHYLLHGPAWQSLDAVARAIYVEIAARYMGTNNGRIPYSVREGADALQISKDTASRAIRALQQRGFIVCVKQAGFNVKTRHAAEWRLTEYPCDVTRALASKDFARWRSENIQNTVPVVGPTVPVIGPNGPCSRTASAEKTRHGPCSRTVTPLFGVRRSL